MFSWAISPQLTEDLALGLFPAAALSRGLVSLSRAWTATQGWSVWFSFHSDCHRSAASLSNSLKCFSFVLNNCPDVGISPLLQFPHPPRAGLILPTLLFLSIFPLHYWVLLGSIYSFPVVRYCCTLSVGVLQDPLCLKVYSWCIHGERYTPCPPTPSSSCSSKFIYFWLEDNWCTILCWSLSYINMIYDIGIHMSPPSLTSTPFSTPSHPLGCHGAPDLSSLHHNKFPLAIYFTYGNVCFHVTLSIRLTLSFPHCVHNTVLYVCISIAALQIGSSVPYF